MPLFGAEVTDLLDVGVVEQHWHLVARLQDRDLHVVVEVVDSNFGVQVIATRKGQRAEQRMGSVEMKRQHRHRHVGVDITPCHQGPEEIARLWQKRRRVLQRFERIHYLVPIDVIGLGIRDGPLRFPRVWRFKIRQHDDWLRHGWGQYPERDQHNHEQMGTSAHQLVKEPTQQRNHLSLSSGVCPKWAMGLGNPELILSMA